MQTLFKGGHCTQNIWLKPSRTAITNHWNSFSRPITEIDLISHRKGKALGKINPKIRAREIDL